MLQKLLINQLSGSKIHIVHEDLIEKGINLAKDGKLNEQALKETLGSIGSTAMRQHIWQMRAIQLRYVNKIYHRQKCQRWNWQRPDVCPRENCAGYPDSRFPGPAPLQSPTHHSNLGYASTPEHQASGLHKETHTHRYGGTDARQKIYMTFRCIHKQPLIVYEFNFDDLSFHYPGSAFDKRSRTLLF